MAMRPKSHDNGRRPVNHALMRDTAYNGRKWRKVSAEFRAAHPLCCKCGKPSELVDHIVPHDGDEGRFWDPTNWAAMCRSCHGSKTFKVLTEAEQAEAQRIRQAALRAQYPEN